ncbi:hypothetical protein [Nafulsella turpanensis]|nr:hypothetical protein [Nafulsella turpanensis]
MNRGVKLQTIVKPIVSPEGRAVVIELIIEEIVPPGFRTGASIID